MTERDAGYLDALSDVHFEVGQMALDPSVSPEGRLELLGVLSVLNELTKIRAVGHASSAASNENSANRDD